MAFDEILCPAARGDDLAKLSSAVGLSMESLILFLFVASITLAFPKAINRYFNGSNWLSRRSALMTCTVIFLSILLAAAHLGTNIFLFVHRPHLSSGENGPRQTCAPARAFLLVSSTIIILLGDILAVYRSVVIHSRYHATMSYSFFVPHGVFLFLCIVVLCATVNRLHLDDRKAAAWFTLTSYALSIALHFMCTWLVVGKIWKQYAYSRAAGLEVAESQASVRKLATPIWQGTLLYSSVLAALIALFVTDCVFYWSLQAVITPLIGLNCVIMSLRMDTQSLSERIIPLSNL